MDDLVLLILFLWVAYLVLGTWLLTGQLCNARARRPRDFGAPEYRASIIVGLRGAHPRLKEALVSLCSQRYPRSFEVVMACESKKDPAWAIGVEVAHDHPNVRMVESDPVDPGVRTGKNQNLLAGVEVAGHEVLVFTDADVVHSETWLARLVAPLGHMLEDREISATTSLFYISPGTFWSRLAAIAVNQVNFAAANLRHLGPWAPFASGASTAVLRSAFKAAGIERAWRECFNDDLVMANLLIDNDLPIYLLEDVTWPEEALANSREFFAKFRRWIVTLHFYSHPKLARQAYMQASAQQQLPVALVLAMGLFLSGTDLLVCLALALGGALYNLFSRASIAMAIDEPLGPWLLLSPVAFLFFIGHYLLMLTRREFIWAGRTHRVRESYGALTTRLKKTESRTSFNDRR